MNCLLESLYRRASLLTMSALLILAACCPVGTSASEVIFLDRQIEDRHILLGGIREGVEIVTINESEDGMIRIADTLRSRSNLSAIHILSHAEAGKLFLGSATLSAENLHRYAAEMNSIRHSLQPRGEVLVYGCELAAGESGRAFAEALSASIGAEVAASTDETGPAVLGGNWDLEFTTGSIETGLALTESARDAYTGATLGFTTGQFLTGSANTNNQSSTAVGPDGTIYGLWKYSTAGGGNMFLATWNGSTWIEIPGSALTGALLGPQTGGLSHLDDFGGNAIAVDAVGDLHVAIPASALDGGITGHRGLVYGKFDVSAQTWSFQRIFVLSNGSGWFNLSNGEQVMMLDSSGNPHIVFAWNDATNPRNHEIKHAFFNGTSWNVSGTTNAMDGVLVDSIANAGGAEIGGLDAAFDSLGNIHLSYLKEGADNVFFGDIWYTKRTGGTWGTPAEILVPDESTYPTSLAIDGSGNVNIAYIDDISATQSRFRILSNAGGSFAGSDAGTITAPGGATSFSAGLDAIAINASGQRVISGTYYSSGPTGDREAVVVSVETTPGTWVVEEALLATPAEGFFNHGTMSLANDNTVAILVGTRNDEFTSGNLKFAVGIPDALGGPAESPAIGVSQAVSVTGSQATFDFYLENLGDVTLSNLSLPFNLNGLFGSGNFTISSPPSFLDNPGTLTLNPAFNGAATTQLISSGGTLVAGDTARIRVVVTVGALINPGGGLGVYSSQVTVSGTSPASATVSDLSDNGTNPDPDGDNNANEAGENDPTSFTVAQQPVIGTSQTASVSGKTVTFDYYLENFGNVTLQQLSLVSDLDAVFGAGNYSITTAAAFIDDPGTVTLNASYNGSGNVQLFTAGGTLAVGDTAQLRLVVEVGALQDSGSGLGLYTSQVTAAGTSPGGSTDTDLSDNGTNPDPDGDSNPDEAGENDATSFTIAQMPVIGVSKAVSVTGRTVTVDVYVENFGNVALQQVSLPFNLDSILGAGNYSVMSAPTLIDDPGTLVVNVAFDGSANANLLVPGSSTLAYQDTAQVRIVVEVTTPSDQGGGFGMYQSQITGSAQAPDGVTMTSDLSDSGTDPDPDGDGNPSETGEDDVTSVDLKGAIGDLVWDDLNGDGVRDAGEPGISGVVVFLDLDSSGSVNGGEPSATTSGTGAYEIADIAAGTYDVTVDETTLPAGFLLTTGTNPVTETIQAGEEPDDVDFAFSLPETPSLEVTIADDVVNAFDEETSTREALEYAALLGGAQTVTFDPDLFVGGSVTFPIATPLPITGAVTVEGPGTDLLEFDGGDTSSIFYIDDSTGAALNVTLGGFTIRNGLGPAGPTEGGAITNLENLTLVELAIIENESPDGSGGIYSSGPLRVINSLLAGNTGDTAGAIYHEGNGALLISNSTVSGNTGVSAGGVSVNGTAANRLKNTTITAQSGPAVVLASGVSFEIDNSIVAGNTDGDVTGVAGATLVSNGANFIGDPAGAAAFAGDASFASTGTSITDVINVALANNGGTTLTHAIVPGSPAIDGGLNPDILTDDVDLDGDSDTAEATPFDQRGVGFARVIQGNGSSGGAIVDIGAFELIAPPTVNSSLYSIPSTSGPVDLLELTGATPDDGAFFGTGVSGSVFDPSGLPPGRYEISYTITDTFGVSNRVSFTIDLFRSVFQPDLRYGLSGNPGAHDGDDSYGGGQTLRTVTQRPRFNLFFSVENDGNIPDSIRTNLKGVSKGKFEVRVVEQGGAGNVSGAFIRGGHTRPFESGEHTVYKVIVKVKDRFRSVTLGAKVRSKSTSDPSADDLNRVKASYESRFVKPPDLR